MPKIPELLRRLLADRRAVAAAVVAVALPAMLIATGMAADAALVLIRAGQLQFAADAGAGAGREALIAANPGNSSVANTAAQTFANGNMASSLAAADVVQGWWDIKKKTFGAPIPGQTGALFSNAVQVTTRLAYHPVFSALIGNNPISMSRKSTAYKCSNTDYPYTLVADDPTPPTKATVWLSWASGSYAANTSYYYANTNGRQTPLIKFYSPTDGEDVSFVLTFTFSDGTPSTQLQMDTYCKGTFIVAPDAFDWKGKKNITATVLAGSTNNSLAVYPASQQSNYPRVIATSGAIYSPTGSTNQLNAALPPSQVKVTQYPSANGIQYWASIGNPTPDRRSILVY